MASLPLRTLGGLALAVAATASHAVSITHFYAYPIARSAPGSMGFAINATDQIASWVDPGLGFVPAMIDFDLGQGKQLKFSPGAAYVNPAAINSQAQIVGDDAFPDVNGPNGYRRTAFKTRAGAVGNTLLGTLPTGTNSYATGINDAGEIVGWGDTRISNSNAFIIDAGSSTLRNLGSLIGKFGYSDATAINSSGQVVGSSAAYIDGGPEATSHAYITAPHGGAMKDLGLLDGTESWAYAVNASGVVVGDVAYAGGITQAFITDPGGDNMRLLAPSGITDSEARGINQDGNVVGDFVAANGKVGAFVTGDGGVGTYDLNAITTGLAGPLDEAVAINDAGHILAYSGQLFTYILCPTVNCK